MNHQGLINRYRKFLPLNKSAKVITLYEGQTPLLPLENIPLCLEKNIKIYAKFEGSNPTGSFKDRGMTVAISQAVSEGARAVICASTGNTSASAAAFAARARIPCFVIIPSGKIALGKLAQAMAHGAIVLKINGNFDAGMQVVKDLADTNGLAIVNSINPFRLQGQKTAAFEVVDELGVAPDFHCLPVGNAGNISGYWMGYSEYAGERLESTPKDMEYIIEKKICKKPRMLGYQASGAAPFIEKKTIDKPDTVATAIRIGAPQSKLLAEHASLSSNGWFRMLSDKEILKNQSILAEHEGIFCEPASAISFGGAIADIQEGKIPKGSTVVCTLTGHGLKDPDIILNSESNKLLEVSSNREAVADIISSYI